jgi:hypothetical protein
MYFRNVRTCERVRAYDSFLLDYPLLHQIPRPKKPSGVRTYSFPVIRRVSVKFAKNAGLTL